MFRHLSPKINNQDKPQPKKNIPKPPGITPTALNRPPQVGKTQIDSGAKQIKNLNSFLGTKTGAIQQNKNKVSITQPVIVKHTNNSTDSLKMPIMTQKKNSGFDDYYEKKPKPHQMKTKKEEISMSGQSYQSQGYVPVKKFAYGGTTKSIGEKTPIKSKNLVATTLTQNKVLREQFKSPNSVKSKHPESEDKLKRVLSFGSKRSAGARVLSNERSIDNNKKIDTSHEFKMPVSPQPHSKGARYTPLNVSDKKDRSEKDKAPLHIVANNKPSKPAPVLNKPISFKSTPFLNKFPLSASGELTKEDVSKPQKPKLEPLLTTLLKQKEEKGKDDKQKKSFSFNKEEMFLNLKKRQEHHTQLCKQLNTLNTKLELKLFTEDGHKSIELLLANKINQTKYTTIFLAYYLPTHSIYCLKKVNIKESPKHHLKSLINQHKIHQFCKHPHIVRHFASGYDSNCLYQLIEYMQEGTLGHQLKRQILSNMSEQSIIKTKFNESVTSQITKINKIKRILYEIICGLKYLHDKGIVHRDIKPDNIFISHDTYKLGDLGSASYNGSQQFVGTLDYAAPQILSHQSYNRSVDVWSLGCVAYQLDVGRPPFFHMSQEQTKRLAIKIQYDKSLISDKDLRSFIEHMLTSPANRWSCQQLLGHTFMSDIQLQKYMV